MDLLGNRLDRYASASSLSEVGTLLSEEIGEHTPFGSVVVVGGFEGYVDASARGVPAEEVAAFAEELRGYGVGMHEPTLRGDNGDPPLGALRSFTSPVLVSAAGAPRGGFAAVVIDAYRHHPALTAVRDVVQWAAPFLHRCVELDALRAQARQLRSWGTWLHGTLDSLPHPVLVIDHQGRVLVVNRRAEELLVTGGADGLGGGREVTMNNLRFSAFLAQAALEGGDRGSRELAFLDPLDGAELKFQVDCFPLHADGTDRSRIFLLRDVAPQAGRGGGRTTEEEDELLKGAG